VADRRFVWFELFYDLVMVAALVNGSRLIEEHPTVALGSWLGITFVVMLVLWMLTALHANLYRIDDWPRRTLVLIQMFSISIALLAIGRKSESLSDGVGFVALGVAFLSIALMYALAGRSRHRSEARLVTWSMGVGGLVFLVGAPFAESGAWIEGSIFAAGALIGCVPVIVTLLGRVVRKRLVDVEHFSERLGALVVIVLGESFVEVMIRLDGFNYIPNPPVLVAAFLVTFATWSVFFTVIEPRRMPTRVGPLRLWFFAYYFLIFGLMAVAARFGNLVVKPWRETFTLPWIWTVLPLVYVAVALLALWQISRRYAGVSQTTTPSASGAGDQVPRIVGG
jgi:low temperature requirement protein LtrA